MNPPFSSNQNRSGKFSETQKKAMQARENETKVQVEHRDPLAGSVITANSVRTFFSPLGERVLHPDRGVYASIIPITACTGASGIAERKFLTGHFHIERIVTSHDPKSPNFSEKPVSIHEALLIARRRDGADKPTEFISLARMPGHGNEPRAGDSRCASCSGRYPRRQRQRMGHRLPVARGSYEEGRLDSSTVVRRRAGGGSLGYRAQRSA